MHGFDVDTAPQDPAASNSPWWKELNRYHWFVLIVAALGWLFDTMDQQLFNLARVPAMRELLTPASGTSPTPSDVSYYSGISTAVFLLGWATGGLGFGVMGDRVGRAKTMLLTILLYSAFTGLSALSWDIWSFSAFRFLTGLGVGGEFAVGVSLVAEVMPVRARPFALGLLQALSAIGNISAAIISLVLSELDEKSAWRYMFVVGAVPALLAILIRRKLKEPEQWQAASDEQLKKQLGSYGELFSNPRWRKHAFIGLVMAAAGVIGLWGIGFFSVDLNRSVFSKTFETELRAAGEADRDREFVRDILKTPGLGKDPKVLKDLNLPAPNQLLSFDPRSKDTEGIYSEVLKRIKADTEIKVDEIIAMNHDATDEVRSNWNAFLTADVPEVEQQTLKENVTRIRARSKKLSSQLTFWAAITSIMQNIGAFFGIYAFTYVTFYVGRRWAFVVTFILAFLSTVLVFGTLTEFSQIFWMIPVMGFCQLALFGGYAIYFPELFPTHLRSTGTSFCYNVGRFVAACGPWTLGALSSSVFKGYSEPMRPAGVTMSVIFLIGLLVLPFAPETRGSKLPE